MKATEGGVAKTKNPIKAMSTKAKKSARGRSTTKKQPARKKTTTSAATKKKSGDTKKTTTKKKKRIVDSNNETTTKTKRNRRSNRTRNIYNYDELPQDGTTITSDDEIIPYNQQKATSRKNSRRLKGSSIAKSRKGDKSNEAGNDGDETDEESQWDIYDHQIAESNSEDDWNERYRRLQEFHSTHGHSGVPIGWSSEPDFAAWVSRQRQLFREIHSGYRIASAQEEGRWKRLQILNFPLNYEAWLWQRTYNELCEVLNGRNYDETKTYLPPPLLEWVNLQKSLTNHTNAAVRIRLDPDRKRLLEELGVIVGGDSRDSISSWF